MSLECTYLWTGSIEMNADKNPKPFSMIREFHLADWFTLGNAVCGTAALFSTISFVQTGTVRHLYFAGVLVFAALIFDVLDGRVARWRQSQSAMGRELDSLADIISFGITPAMIGYSCGMEGLFDRIILGYFVACGVRVLHATMSPQRNCPEAAERSNTSRGRPYRLHLSSSAC